MKSSLFSSASTAIIKTLNNIEINEYLNCILNIGNNLLTLKRNIEGL